MTTAARPGRRWEPDDLPKLPDDGHRYEIVDGHLRMSPSPPWRHNTAAFELGVVLKSAAPPELAVVVPAGGVLTPRACLIPDLAVVKTAQAPTATTKETPAGSGSSLRCRARRAPSTTCRTGLSPSRST